MASPDRSLADDVWLTSAEVAAYSKRHLVTVHRHAAAGTLKSTGGGRGRGRRYHIDWVEAWMREAPRLPAKQAS